MTSISDEGDYRSFVAEYAAGNFERAVFALAAWDAARLRRVTDRAIESHELPPAHLKAAIMLHTELAFAGNTGIHLHVAQTLVGALPKESPFRQRWLAYSITPLLARGDLRAAQAAVNRALAANPGSAELTLAAGTVPEMRARLTLVDVRQNRDDNMRVRRNLEDAVAWYQRAIAADPECLPCRLRLGWVRLVGHSRTSAREQFDIVRARSRNRDLSYLAHLFLGALNEAEKQGEAALSAYEGAHDLLPDAQSAFVALIRLARMNGDPELAHDLADDYAKRPPTPTEDPWWYFSVGITGSDALAWLRRDALNP